MDDLVQFSIVWVLAGAAAASLLLTGLVAGCVVLHVQGGRWGRGSSRRDLRELAALKHVSGLGGTTHDPTYRGGRTKGNEEGRESGAGLGVTVLKPLKGVTPELYDNLASLARQEYGNFEILFGVEDPGDPAVAVVERLKREFPGERMRLVAGAPALGRNPKVRNLASMTRFATHDLWLISDADVRAPVDYLAALMEERRASGAGLISHPLIGEHGNGEETGAVMEALHLGSFVTGGMCAATRLGHPMVVGKSMLFDRRDLEALGGWRAVADVLAEDYVLGMRFAEAGHRVALARTPLTVVQPRRRVGEFLARHLRWSQMRRWISPAAYLGEPLLNPTPWLLATATTAAASGRWEPVIAAGAGLVLKVALDAVTVGYLSGRVPAVRHLALVPVKDLGIFAVWGLGWLRRTVDWRGNRLRLGPGSELLPEPVT